MDRNFIVTVECKVNVKIRLWIIQDSFIGRFLGIEPFLVQQGFPLKIPLRRLPYSPILLFLLSRCPSASPSPDISPR
jgi:hypothetical protein